MTQRLDAGEWKPGEAIPSEIELAARYKVNQGTVRKSRVDQALREICLLAVPGDCRYN